MKYSVVSALTVASTILAIASPALGGGIRGGSKGEIDASSIEIEEARRILNEIEEESKADSVGFSNNDDVSRLLKKKDIQELLEESGDDEEEEKEEEDEIAEKEEYVPIVTADCADTEGLIEVAESGDKLNCRQIRKTKICEREHNGKHLYESCQKSCEICLEAIPSTDAPTADLVELVVTDSPTDVAYKSIAPSYQPTSITTELPTTSPSQYPTPSPTTMMIVEDYIKEETEEPTFENININVTATIDPTDNYESKSPSYQPTIKFTDDPTETPSHYPTDSPTENAVESMMQGLDDDILLSVLGDIH